MLQKHLCELVIKLYVTMLGLADPIEKELVNPVNTGHFSLMFEGLKKPSYGFINGFETSSRVWSNEIW